MFKGGYIMIDKNFVVEKSNIFVELKNINMTLQELRFFCIYLGRINARDISTRCVRFDLSEFREIMNLGRLNIKHLQDATNKLLCKVINIPKPSGGYKGFTLFKRVVVDKDESESWYIDIDCSDDALPYFFDLSSSGYVSYRLYNVLSLKSVHQIRLYELFKKYLKIGIVEISISDLHDYLCLSKSYDRFERFRTCIIDDTQAALLAHTDICYTYERGKVGNRGKWLTIIFHIYKNTEYKNPLKLDEFIKIQPTPEKLPEQQTEVAIPIPPPNKENRKSHLSGNLEKDLTQEEISLLCDLLSYKVQKESERTQDKLIERLRIMYSVSMASSSEPIRNAFAYLKKTVININPDNLPTLSSGKNKNFNIEKYKIFVNDF